MLQTGHSRDVEMHITAAMAVVCCTNFVTFIATVITIIIITTTTIDC